MTHDWITYKRRSFDLLQEYKKSDLICAELGVFQGHNAVYMLETDSTMLLYLIDGYVNMENDPYPNGIADLIKEAEENLFPFKDRIVWIRKQAEEAVKDYPDEYFDYVYIDANHFEGIFKDITDWYPKVKAGGILAGHDIGMPTVEEAVGKFIHENNIKNWGISHIEAKESDWWIFK